MITLRSIKEALTASLKRKYPNYKVHFDNVEKQSKEPYFYVEMMPTVTTVDDVYHDRLIQIDITFYIPYDQYGRVDRMLLYDMIGGLDLLIRPVFYVEDRAITILEAETTLVDDILHYIFTLDFRDAVTDDEAGRMQYELMQQLQLRINDEDRTEEE